MDKDTFKANHRNARLAANPNNDAWLGDVMSGKRVSTFDNSAVWAMQAKVASEVAPEVRKRQMADRGAEDTK